MIKRLLALFMFMGAMPISSKNYNQQISIKEIKFQYYQEEVKLTIETDIVTDNSSKVIININSYGLEDDKVYANSYTYLANSSRFYISVAAVTEKTLFEIETHNILYPELSNTYNFILNPCGEIIDNHSINPVKISFENDIIFYEDFNFKNIEKIVKYSLLSSIFLPELEGQKNGNVRVYISLPIEDVKEEDNYYLLDTSFKDGKISIKDIFYDFKNHRITYTEGLKIDNINLPVPGFTLKIVFENLGDSNSNYEIVQEYKNTKEFFGECEVAVFCFI